MKTLRHRLAEHQHQQALADAYLADREAAIFDFLNSLDNPAADPYELRKRQHELGITNEMIDAHRAKRNAEVKW